MKSRLFTSESVTEGHPDKLCDGISDAILDEIYTYDPMARVACETAATKGLVHVMGEITTTSKIDFEKVVRKTIKDIGYTKPEYGLCGDSCGVLVSINEQSSDISMGVDTALESRGILGESELGAGDQGMMFGYACSDNKDYMPTPIYLAHKLTQRLTAVRKQGILDYLRPDGKSQVTVEYQGDTPTRVHTVLIAAQHAPEIRSHRIKKDIIENVIKPVIPEGLLDDNVRILVNTTGRFVHGGPAADCGLTGRKIIVDTYGGYASHGGGAFSGKDPTKVDRTGSYGARHSAKNIVAAGLASQCAIEIAYAIGVAHPVSVMVDTRGTGKISDSEITRLLLDKYDFRPHSLIEKLNLRRPIYKQVAAYGHFGRSDLDLPWERLDYADVFRNGI